MSNKLSKSQWVNKKALSLIYKMLSNGDKAPAIYEAENVLWVTNNYLAFAFKKDDFIFNSALFRNNDSLANSIKGALESAKEKAIIPARFDGYKFSGHGNKYTNARLVADGFKPTYVNKEFLDCFSDDCAFLKSENPIDPVLVISPYGETCGLIMAMRVKEDE